MKNNPFTAIIAVTVLPGAALTTAEAAAKQPNIVVILTDDQGYADISLNPHHPKEVSTPNMDALAADGVLFSQGYTSGHVCSPTRAGLMLGRYQQRVGVYSAGEGGRGFDPTLPVFPSFLPEEVRFDGDRQVARRSSSVGRPSSRASESSMRRFFSLDILPTALDAIGVEPPADAAFDARACCRS